MKNYKFLYLVLLLFTVIGFVSCGETSDEESEYINWQPKNETYFTNLRDSVRQLIKSGRTDWRIYPIWSQADSVVGSKSDSIIIVHVEEAGKGSGCPIYSDSVRVHYYAWRMPSTSYPSGYVFDSSYSTNSYDESISIPSKIAVSGVVDGFSTALQHMHIGDKWSVIVPYQLGYGTSSSGTTVPPYSTLVFDIKLMAYYKAGQIVPVWK
jgi:FKBP-type peptidyl-prolyl cis-trans isomerase FklB